MRRNLTYLYTGFGLSILASVWTIFHITFGSWILIPAWFFLVTIYSGSLLFSQFLDARSFSFSEWIIYVTGLGLLQFVVLGLILNTIGLNIHHPTLITNVVTLMFETLLAILSLLVVVRSHVPYLLPDTRLTNNLAKFIALLPFVFPVISVLGANRLNNGASGSLTIGLYVCMIVFAGLVILFKKFRNEYALSSSLWGISFAILLSVSMRSNHFIGYDINQEFQVFSATVKAGLWHPHLFQNTYNACLSITILPTMLKALMPISPEYIFKFVMQGIFSFAPIGVYVLAKYFMRDNKKATTYAFISALFFIVQYQFLNEFPALIRQQTATIFFALVFISATSSKLTKPLKSILILLFGLGMIVSHYSTAYICLGLLLLMLLFKPILSKASSYFNNSNVKHLKESSWNISPLLVTILFLLSFMWYGEILSSTGGIVQKIEGSITNFGHILSNDSRSPFVNATFGINSYSETPQLLNQASSARQSHSNYGNSVINKYEVSPVLPPTPQVNSKYQSFILGTVNRYIPALVKLVVVVGLLFIVIASIRNIRVLEEGALIMAAGVIFVLMVALPSLSQDYNIERLYQQLLVFISSSFVIGTIVLIKRARVKYVEGAVFTLLVAYFLCTSGVISQLTFGMSNINFDGLDLNYVHFYSTDGDIDSLRWLQIPYYQHPSIINIDQYSKLKTYTSTTLPAHNLVPGLFPSQITTSSYVYASHINLQDNIVFDSYNKHALSYAFPSEFLNSNKNTIYSNNDSIIYK